MINYFIEATSRLYLFPLGAQRRYSRGWYSDNRQNQNQVDSERRVIVTGLAEAQLLLAIAFVLVVRIWCFNPTRFLFSHIVRVDLIIVVR